MLEINCPKCGKTLISILPIGKGFDEFFCDNCLLTIEITQEVRNEQVSDNT